MAVWIFLFFSSISERVEGTNIQRSMFLYATVGIIKAPTTDTELWVRQILVVGGLILYLSKCKSHLKLYKKSKGNSIDTINVVIMDLVLN